MMYVTVMAAMRDTKRHQIYGPTLPGDTGYWDSWEVWAPGKFVHGIVFLLPHHCKSTPEGHQDTWGQWKFLQAGCPVSSPFPLQGDWAQVSSTSLSPFHSSPTHEYSFINILHFATLSPLLQKNESLLSFCFLPPSLSSCVLQIKPHCGQDLRLGFMMTWKSKLINFELKLQTIKNYCHQILMPLKIPNSLYHFYWKIHLFSIIGTNFLCSTSSQI